MVDTFKWIEWMEWGESHCIVIVSDGFAYIYVAKANKLTQKKLDLFSTLQRANFVFHLHTHKVISMLILSIRRIIEKMRCHDEYVVTNWKYWLKKKKNIFETHRSTSAVEIIIAELFCVYKKRILANENHTCKIFAFFHGAKSYVCSFPFESIF